MSIRVGTWLALEAAPTFRVLRLEQDEIERIGRERLRSALDRAARTELGRRRFREAGLPAGSGPRDGGSRAGARGARGFDPAAVLRALPPVGKAELRAAGDDALIGGRVVPSWRSSRSSGSTGEPFRVFYDPRAWAILKHLIKLRARAACGVRPAHRLALLDAAPPEEEGRTALERAGRIRRISVLQPADRIAAALAAFAPDAIYGLPSALVEAGRALPRDAGPSAGWTPRAIFTSGELLSGAMRHAIERAYGCRVFDVYGTSETKEIAWECAEGGLHINADVVRVEILDGAGDALPEGEEGEIVATLLVNAAMPLIRYRTGDRGSLVPGPCPCGLPLPRLGVVTGREADVLDLEGGRRLSPYALTSALERVHPVLRYQVTQLDGRRLRVRAMLDGARDRAHVAARIHAAAQIQEALRTAAHVPLRVDVEFVDRFETGPNAKFRVVQSAADGAAPDSGP